MRSPFLSRRFVIGSLVAFGILVANAFVTYRTIANLIEASRIAENTLKVVEALKDLQKRRRRFADRAARLHHRGERDRSNGSCVSERTAKSYVRNAAGLCRERSRSDAADRVARRADRRGARAVRHLIEIHERNGVAATILNIRERRARRRSTAFELLTAELQGAAIPARAPREQSRAARISAVITAVVATLFNLGRSPLCPARAAGNQGEAAGGRGASGSRRRTTL